MVNAFVRFELSLIDSQGVTIVDGIDTAIIMDLRDVVAKQLAFIQTIDFTSVGVGGL